CLLKASNSIFSDPCFGTYKYLDISYSCVPPKSGQTCEGQQRKLECGSNVIHIHAASYGRTDKTTCSAGRPANQLSRTDCSASTTLPIVRERCEGRTTCLLKALNSIFSDPCGGIYKYLNISYSCVPPNSSNVIRIHTASYGRRDKTNLLFWTPCESTQQDDCSASTTLPIVRESIFSNPCAGVYKYLNISYSCVPPS
ncbi:L-rhamnose-binding lectin CSL2-like, partial [Clupea harengus]|uniref:L-rhamnose-binding lectin CSL2-like n=1 Tax=Clupea harengus TaxID=7950 RepID=A0A8M1KIJ4_CLUHA